MPGKHQLYSQQYEDDNNFEDESDAFLHDKLRIDDFNIYTTLGTGTFGRVRQAKIKADPRGKVYALKMLKKTEIVKLNQVDHIKSEKNILQGIRHPFIVNL